MQRKGIRATVGAVDVDIPIGAFSSGEVLTYDGTQITTTPGGGGSPTGAAGGDLGGTYPNPTVTQARGLRETSGPTTLVNGAVATGQLLQRSGSTLIGVDPGVAVYAGIGAAPLWVPPAAIGVTPNALDDEFDSTTLNAAWAFYDSIAGINRTPSGAVDPFSALTGAAAVPRTTLHTNGRRSWIKFQTTDTANTFYYMHKNVTAPGTCFWWCRASTGSGVAGPARIQLFISPALAGLPDVGALGTSNMVAIGAFNNASAASIALSTISAGGAVSNTAISTSPNAGFQFEYFGLYKSGTTVYAMAFDEKGNVVDIGSISVTWTIGKIGFRVLGSPTGIGAPLHQMDFLRQDATWRF